MSKMPAIENPAMKTAKRKLRLAEPHAYLIIFAILVIALIGTWFVPAGEYNRVLDPATKRMIAVAGSYHTVDPRPVGLWEFWQLIVKGFQSASIISTCLLIVGGTFGLITQTGAIDAFIAKVISRFRGTKFDIWSLILVYAFFYVCAITFGIGEQAMVFMPVFLIMAISLGYDAVVANAILTFALALGYTGALTCPYSILLGQTIAGLPLASGLWFRASISPIIFMIGAWWILRYAKKIKADPSKSLVADIDYSHIKVDVDPESIVLTPIHKRVLYVFGGSFLVMMYVIIQYKFNMADLAAMYLIIAILVGIAAKMSPNKVAEGFVEGSKSLLFAALLVGFARAIQTVLEAGMIQDTVINALTTPLQYLPQYLLAPAMVLIQSIINLIIPSQSAMAMVTMPIMAPLADLIGIQRQTAVLAYQFGDGVTNLILPTWAILMIGLGFTKIPFVRWFKFTLPLCGILIVVTCIMATVAEIIKVGPF